MKSLILSQVLEICPYLLHLNIAHLKVFSVIELNSLLVLCYRMKAVYLYAP